MKKENSRGSASLFEKKPLDLLKRNSSTPNSKTNKLMRRVRINPRDAPEIQKQPLFAETLSSEIREAGKERENTPFYFL